MTPRPIRRAGPAGLLSVCGAPPHAQQSYFHRPRMRMGSLIKKRRKKMSKHKYRKRVKANRHKKQS